MNAPATLTAVRPESVAAEWVTLDPLAQCEAFRRRLADRVCIG
jgi:hypothetical protein